jgi:hypothetical protein
MTPTDCLLQNLESGPLDYTERQVEALGADVRGAAADALARGLISSAWTNEKDEDGNNVRRVTWTITPKGIARMEDLRAGA